MRNTNKKGFTIVELVIVVAVIAILAAVLIPTFSSIIKKANLSNDKSFVRNMNVTLAAEGAVESFKTAGDAIDALNRNGFAGKYNTYSTNYHYCYSLENNRMYLLDDSNVVVYPEEEVAVSSLWGLYTDNRVSVTTGVTKYVAMCNITNSDHYNDVFASGTYTIDLNGYYIDVQSTLDVTANNGIVLSGANAGEGTSSDYTLVEADGEIQSNELLTLGTMSDGVLTVSNKIFNDFVHTTNINQAVVFENCIFYGEGLQFGDASGLNYKAIVKNCKFIATQAGRWALMTFGSMDVIDCTFTNLNGRGAIQIHEDSENMEINISGCTFDGTNGEYPLIRFVGKYTASKTTGIANLTISDCNFTALNKSVGIIGFSGEGSSLYNYTGAAGQATVTFSNNKFGEKIDGKYLVTEGEYKAGTNNTLGTLLGQSAK